MTMAAVAERRRPIPNYVVGLGLLLVTELMFFGGLVSAFLVTRGAAAAWPPPGQPRLPIERTAVNTAILLLSGWTMTRAFRCWRHQSFEAAAPWLRRTLVAGAAFVVLQGIEWLRLVHFGLTTTSSIYGGFFYLIVGAHAVHVTAGLGLLSLVATRFQRESWITAATIYWWFVVALWPILYGLVYLR